MGIQFETKHYCILCHVPDDVHGTCCGWENAKAICNIVGIIIDSRHPGFGKQFTSWNVKPMNVELPITVGVRNEFIKLPPSA